MSFCRPWSWLVFYLLLFPPPASAAAPILRELDVPQAVYSLAFSADGKQLAVQAGNRLYLWNTATGKEICRISEGLHPGEWSMAFSPDARVIYAPLIDSSVAAWEVSSGKLLRQFKGHTATVWCVALSADGKFLASGSEDGTARVWDPATGRELYRLEHDSPVWPVAFDPEGRTLACQGSAGMLRLWDVRTGKELTRFATEPNVWPIAFAADGRGLATVPWQGTIVRLWDLKGKECRSIEIASGTGWNLAFSPDGRTLASGGPGSALCLWETSTGRERLRLSGHQGAITAVAFSPDGRVVATAGHDNRVLLWDVTGRLRDGRLEPVRPAAGELSALADRLCGRDPAQAYQALWTLAAAPAQAVPLLTRRVGQLTLSAPEADRVTRLIAALDDDRFGERERASEELRKLGGAVEVALRRALRGRPSAEQVRRIGTLLEEIGPDEPAEVVTGRRVAEVLEQIGTPQALRALEELAHAGVAPEVREEARASLRRLRGRH
jgi:hypothetical protein